MEEKESNREEHGGAVLTGAGGGLVHLLHLVAAACFCWSIAAQPCLLGSARREGGTGRGAGRGSVEQGKAAVGERSREQQRLGIAGEEQNLVAAEYGRSRERAQN
jgi:hypothetical protein